MDILDKQLVTYAYLSEMRDKKLVYTPAEFGEIFGHGKIWAYRLIYDGKLKVITGFGRKMIPASEVERILASAQENVVCAEKEA